MSDPAVTVSDLAAHWKARFEEVSRDRDELVAALEKAVAFHWADLDYDPEPHQDHCRALLARVKGR